MRSVSSSGLFDPPFEAQPIWIRAGFRAAFTPPEIAIPKLSEIVWQAYDQACRTQFTPASGAGIVPDVLECAAWNQTQSH